MGSHATFSVVRKGYDKAEVDNHLRSLRLAGRQVNDELQARVERLEAELADARKREEAVQITLVAATKTREEMLEVAQIELTQEAHQARTSAEDIVSDAQFEAFRLVTQAKKDAEATINAAQEEAAVMVAHPEPIPAPEAQDTAAVREAVEAQARARIEEIRIEALSTIREIRKEAEEVISSRDARITELRAKIDGATAATANEVPTTAPIETASIEPPATTSPPADSAVDDEEEDRTREKVREAGRPMANEDMLDDSDAMPLSDRPVRGSFYSRRSARLPRIGTEAANGALAAVSAMRTKSRGELEERAEGVPGDAEEDMAMQSV